MIHFACPACPQTMTVDDCLARQTVSCPGCGQHLRIPPPKYRQRREPRRGVSGNVLALIIVSAAVLVGSILCGVTFVYMEYRERQARMEKVRQEFHRDLQEIEERMKTIRRR